MGKRNKRKRGAQKRRRQEEMDLTIAPKYSDQFVKNLMDELDAATELSPPAQAESWAGYLTRVQCTHLMGKKEANHIREILKDKGWLNRHAMQTRTCRRPAQFQ